MFGICCSGDSVEKEQRRAPLSGWMREYDITLKRLLTHGSSRLLAKLTGLEVKVWHNVELPLLQTRQADLLGETADGKLVHVELQSTNDPTMASRMLKYAIAIEEKFDRYPHQLVLYVGRSPLQMPRRVRGPGLEFECLILDMRDVESSELLASGSLEDSVLAVLARFSDQAGTIREILERIQAGGAHQEEAMAELTILAGLRKLVPIIEEELKRMPILEDIRDHEIIGPWIEQGIERGIEKGIEKGRVEGERQLLLKQLERRFGPLTNATTQKIQGLSLQEVEDLGLRLMDGTPLDELVR